MKRTWNLNVTIDATVGETYQGVVELDGREYEVNIVPADQLRRIRHAKRHLREDGSLGGFEKEGISLGPRGGGCPCCGG